MGHAIENDLQVNIGGTCYRERLTGILVSYGCVVGHAIEIDLQVY